MPINVTVTVKGKDWKLPGGNTLCMEIKGRNSLLTKMFARQFAERVEKVRGWSRDDTYLAEGVPILIAHGLHGVKQQVTESCVVTMESRASPEERKQIVDAVGPSSEWYAIAVEAVTEKRIRMGKWNWVPGNVGAPQSAVGRQRGGAAEDANKRRKAAGLPGEDSHNE